MGEKSAVVCDITGQVIKYGLAEDYTPIYKFPAILGRPKNSKSIGEKIKDLEIKEILFGNDALQLQSELNISYPIKDGIIENWEDMTLLLEYIFKCDNIKMDPKNTKIFLTQTTMNTAKNREKISEIMFKHFGFHSVFIGKHAAAFLIGQGITAGVVIDFHENFTDISPVHMMVLKDLVKRVPASDNNKNISELIFNTIQSADVEVRLDLFKRIALIGDTNIQPSTIENDVKHLYLKNVLLNDSEKLKRFKVRVDKYASDNEKVYVGGALLAKVNIERDAFWITKKEFESIGLKVLDKCI
ncbi:CLUMA_CG015780, isoform A [Clunio marinus]|uniref:CLUMA_CG015780, isoform A n=1 Tax=Clunio marinus TaxID=568069 RepID=A0A1J1ITZ2_9DIPT|nr:CLUMA_CG015780, isoform A [Clunio marinus]